MPEAATLIGAREPVILTVDNGGTRTRVTRFGRGENTLDKIAAYNTPKNCDRAIRRIGKTARLALDGKRPDAIGVSIAGKVEQGRIVSAGALDKWKDLPFAENLAAELGVSPERIVLLNDCEAGANAERTARRLTTQRAGAFMVLSTGFGAAVYTDNELIADEPGHYYLKPGAMCGDKWEGHIEAHIAGDGIKRKYGTPGEHIPHDDPRWQEIKGDFHDGTALTLDRYERIHKLTLDVIGFTGSVALGGPDMLGDLQRDLIRRYDDRAPRIEHAYYGEESGLYGAAFAADELLRAA